MAMASRELSTVAQAPARSVSMKAESETQESQAVSPIPESRLPHPPPVRFCRLFRNPESGHELGTKSAEDNVGSGGSGIVIAPIAGRGSFERTSMIIRATPPMRSRTRPVANVRGDPIDTNSPNTRSHTGIIAVRLDSIDMVAILLSCGGLRTTRRQPAVAVPIGLVDFSPGAREAGFLDPRLTAVPLRRYLDLDLLGLGFLTQRQPDGQHARLVLGADLASVDRRRQRERPRERAVTALDAMKLLLRDFRVELPLATERERVVFKGQVDLLFLHVGQLGPQHQLVLAVGVNVDRRYP